MRIVLITLFVLLCTLRVQARDIESLDFDWRFTFFEIYNDLNEDTPYDGGPQGLEAVDVDDRTWKQVNLPHDWAIEGDYHPDHPTRDNAGYLQAGIGWYRKVIDVPAAWSGQRLWLEFDGVFRNSTVWVNGVNLGTRPYGWISFGYDITRSVTGKDKAVIAVRVDNSQQNAARWYTGSGIYAPVRLVITDPVHIAPWGTFVRTQQNGDNATVQIDTEMANDRGKPVSVGLRTRILDPLGKCVAQQEASQTIPTGQTVKAMQEFAVPQAQPWSCETPHLYTAVSEIVKDGQVVDRTQTRFGIRTVAWRKDTGFWLNGENVKLKGVCNHQDAGPLGAAVPDKILRFRLQQLKAMGCNAFRTAHNPQTPLFYDLCDEMGILVMDEIFDGWKRKAPADYGAFHFETWWRRDVRDWIRRDRNHPCVIIWSVGNETHRKDAPIAQQLVAHCHSLDPTRLVTSGSADPQAMDVYGVNGGSESQGFPERHAAKMDRPFVATEYPHTWQVRGFYETQTWYRDGFPNKRQKPYPIANLTTDEIFHLDWTHPRNKTNLRKQRFNSSYDNAMVRISARRAWQQVRDIPWWSGQFRWTGHDYLGEGGYVHGGWPFKAFMGGAIDLCNFEKDLYYLYQSQWTEKPMVHILPHWTHPTLPVGTEIPVWVLSNGETVELWLNDKSLGRKQPGTNWDQMQCEWLVPWQPGTLKAVAYRNHHIVAQTEHRTAQAPANLELISDSTPLKPDGRDIAQVTVRQRDAHGVFYPYGENRIYFHLDGPARIRALGNGSPLDVEPHYGVTSRVTFFGLAKAFVESTRSAGDVTLIAGAISGEKQQLSSDRVSIDVQQYVLRGTSKPLDVKIYYTLDGTQPTSQSRPYTGPIPVVLGTTVKAVVYRDGNIILNMEERFAKDEGLYWGRLDPAFGQKQEIVSIQSEQGLQAEKAQLNGGAAKVQRGSDYRSQGFVTLPKAGSITWYVENDGNPADYDLHFRYAGKDPKGGRAMKLEINGRVVVPKQILKNTGAWGAQWQTWTTRQRLGRGANEIRLSTVGRNGMDIDELVVKPVQ